MLGRKRIVGTYEELPPKTRKAVELTTIAIQSLKDNATQQDWDISSHGMTFRSAISKTEALLAKSRMLDEYSLSTIVKVAPLWNFAMKALAEERDLTIRVTDKLRHEGRTTDAEWVPSRVHGLVQDELIQALEGLRRHLI